MILEWKISYVDTRDRKLKERSVRLNTADLAPAEKVAVEAAYNLMEIPQIGTFSKFRHLFHESPVSNDTTAIDETLVTEHRYLFFHGYFEDQNGTRNRIARSGCTPYREFKYRHISCRHKTT